MIKTALIYLVQYNLSKFKNGRYGLSSMLIYVQITHLESLSIIVILWHHNLKFSADEKYYGPIWCVIIHQNRWSTYMVQRTYSIILILLIHYTHPDTPSTTHNPNTPQTPTPINPTFHSIDKILHITNWLFENSSEFTRFQKDTIKIDAGLLHEIPPVVLFCSRGNN